MHTDTNDLKLLSDTELVARMMRFALRERAALVELIAHLAEFDTRSIYLSDGYRSLFAYCTEVFGFSEHETLNRIAVARAARRFPAILDLLADGSVNLTAVRLVAPHLTAENHRAVLESIRKKSTRDVERIVATLAPRPPAPESIRKTPAPQHSTAPLVPTAASGGPQPPVQPPALPSLPPSSPRRDAIQPSAPNVYSVHLSIREEIYQKLECARDLLRHTVPDGNLQEILHRALQSLIRDLLKQKFAVTASPRPGRAKNPDDGEIRAEVRRAVFLRSLGACEHVGPRGRCGSRAFVEFHHTKPRAVGGSGASAGEVMLVCRSHNQYAAEIFFGRRWRPADSGEDTAARGNSLRNELAAPGSPGP